MMRRMFNTLVGASLAAVGTTGKKAFAETADASQLISTLNPMGGEMVGNVAGTIPAWTGGMTAIPAGTSWNPDTENVPDFWPNDQPLYEVNQGNIAKYAELLSDGAQWLVKNKGLRMKVYPTRRTAAVPAWVADNIKANVGRALLDPHGGRFGFTGAYGGYPFPIPDESDPLAAGAQCLWNHECRWPGAAYLGLGSASHVVVNGEVTLSQASVAVFKYPYYLQGGDPSTYNGYTYQVTGPQFAPANVAGDNSITYESSNELVKPTVTWQLLAGQGRVRKAPEILYDVPASYLDGLANYDEYFNFGGPGDRYDWKLLGKREMLIPYNNNNMLHVMVADALGPNFVNPDVLRWELHRVWVVDATLHQGERNVLARRRLYFDEDTWIAGIVDSWDAKGNIFRHGISTNAVLPNLPGTIYNNNFLYNLQTGDYVSVEGTWADEEFNHVWQFNKPVTDAMFNPQNMAATANY